MKKIWILLLAVTVFLAQAALAEAPSPASEPGPLPRFTNFRGAVNGAGESAAVGGDMEYLAVAMGRNGRFFRAVALLDDRARELYMAAMTAEDDGEAFEAFDAYAWSLPVTYTEEITAKPKEQAELDALAGKTVGEVLEEGYLFYGSGGGINLPTIVDLSYGFFSYTFEVDATFEEYQEAQEREELESLRVRSGKLEGFSSIATSMDYLADGTLEPQVVPHITAEEAAAAASVPPAEEYTRNAWPLTAEGYEDLQHNPDTRYGQVYMVEGVVHEVLSQDPLRVVVNTGEDGETRPVVLEYPVKPPFTLEAGSRFRVYADASSVCYILPVLAVRYTYFTQP